jgi:class 3 adenylate cyclase
MTSCPACGKDSAADARFCSQCGAPLEDSSTIGAETRNEVFSTLRGEERLVTVVFADMSESVRRTSGLDAEEATGLVNPLLEAMVELMTRYGGRIDRFLGDGILAVFGVPSAHEDDPIRAVWAALELRERAHELELPVTVGVNTGRVYFGPVGSSVHEELTVMGPTVNLAARFQSAASAGEVIVGASTEAQAQAAFSLTAVTLTIKGIAEPVTAFRAERLLDHPDKVRGIADLETVLVGREPELVRLMEARSEGGAVALVGPAGVGKSRLAAELHAVVTSEDGEWLEGHCLEISRATPYAPFQDLFLRHLSSADPLSALEVSLQDLTEAGELAGDRATDIAPFLAYLLGIGWGDRRDAAVTEAEPEVRHGLTVDAVATYLVAGTRRRPVVVFIDDIHWADPLSLDIVSRLATVRSTQMLVLATSRPPSSAWADTVPAPFEELTLGELDRDDARALLSALLDVDGVSGSLAEQILDQAHGNPFYVEELIRSLIQRGAITRYDGGWQMTTDDIALEVPPSVEGVLMARFDRLPEATRRAAKAASVLGMTVDEALFAAVAGPGLDDELANLVGAGIVEPAAGEGHAFVHALTREAIYMNLLPSQRAELHERAAVILEDLGPLAVERIAHHYENSRNDLKAVEFLCRAGEHALDAFTTESARGYLTRGLHRIESLDESEQPVWRGRIHARLGELSVRLAEHEAARSSLRTALAEMDPDPLERARVWRLLGQSHRLQRGYDEAHRAYDQAEQALADLGEDPVAKRAWVDVARERSLALYFGGRGREMAEHSRRVEPIVDRYGTAAQQSDFLLGRTLQSFVEHRYVLAGETVDLARRAASLAEDADPGRIAETRFVLGFSLLWADRLEEAAHVLTSAVTLTGRVGNATELCRALAYRAVAVRRLGLVDEAEQAAEEALASARAIGLSYYTGHAHAVQCWVEWKRGTGACDRVAGEAYEAWGREDSDGRRGLSSEFAWLAVWPRAAEAHRHGDTATAIDHLRLLQAPWERPMPDDLAAQVAETVESGSGHRLPDVFAEAERHAFL